MKKRIAASLAISVLASTAMTGLAGAAAPTVPGPMAFDPIPGSAYDVISTTWTDDPYVIPDGFTQKKVLDETDFDVHPGEDDLPDMNTQNETGFQAGRYLYRTQEVNDLGTVVAIDLWGIRAPRMLVQEGDPAFPAITSATDLDGIRWTPWGTILFAEEELEEPVVGTQDFGHIYEITLDRTDPMKAVKVKDLPQVGRLRHEGIEIDSAGNVYVIDELNGGSIFKFVPKRRGDLSKGQLYALKLKGLTTAEQKFPGTGNPHIGGFEWVALDMTQVVVNANAAADAVFATEYGRPEDVEIIGNTLYVANTTEDRVIAIDLSKKTVASFVEKGVKIQAENISTKVTGFNNPDNLVEGPEGLLWIAEDNQVSDIWVAEKDKNKDGLSDGMHLFASLRDWNGIAGEGAESSGIYFGKDPKKLYINIQHADKALADGTWVISKKRGLSHDFDFGMGDD